jgi:hypothetical protein
VSEPCGRSADESEDCDEVLHIDVGGVDVDRREGGMTVDEETAERKTTCLIPGQTDLVNVSVKAM